MMKLLIFLLVNTLTADVAHMMGTTIGNEFILMTPPIAPRSKRSYRMPFVLFSLLAPESPAFQDKRLLSHLRHTPYDLYVANVAKSKDAKAIVANTAKATAAYVTTVANAIGVNLANSNVANANVCNIDNATAASVANTNVATVANLIVPLSSTANSNAVNANGAEASAANVANANV
ncbi:hypothetical protein BgiBS90_029780 [Biomphalaria glabrata]|nr:hypothetical protein BgiBS90_029780 [Biomphalaria glabrata]